MSISEKNFRQERPASLETRRLQAEIHLDSGRVLRGMERRIMGLFRAGGVDGLTPAQGNVLMVLFHQRAPTRARGLAKLLNVSEVTMGRFVQALEGAGWISRSVDPEDARARLVSPTAQAYALLPTLIRVSNRLMDEAFQGFKDEDIAQLHDLTHRLIRNLEP